MEQRAQFKTFNRLIAGYLEHISSKVFDNYHESITKLIGNRHGVYALYKKRRLYYVGLATNLRMRVKHHLKDRHSKKWDTFSLYLIHNAEHLKELESLVIHVAEPKGNIARGGFRRSLNLLKELKQAMEERNKEQIERILPSTVRRDRRMQVAKQRRTTGEHIRLAELLHLGTEIHAWYKKQEFRACVEESGKINLNGTYFNTPSGAGSYIRGGKQTNGWMFWKYQNEQGRWVFIDELRKKHLKKVGEQQSENKRTVLAGLLSAGTEVQARYRKTVYTATIDANGVILYGGQQFRSPSGAGKYITGKAIDGWHLWKYRNEEGEWVEIDELRKKKSRNAMQGKKDRGKFT